MRKKRQPISNINVVPYLDVMLVLLVIFMITAPLFNQGVVELPSVGDAQVSGQQSGAFEVVYEASGVNPFRLIDHENNAESPQLSLDELLFELSKENLLRPNVPLVVAAAAGLQYTEVMELLGHLRNVGYSNIGLVVKNETVAN